MIDSIFQKAQKLGLSINENSSTWDNLSYIASQLGIADFNPEKDLILLDDLLTNEINARTESPDGLSFGEREFNEAKDEKGIYNRDYYKKRAEELDKKVEEAEEERAKKTKEEVDLDENGNAKWKEGEAPRNRTWENGKETTKGAPTKQVDKSNKEKLKDNYNLAKAKKDRLDNKINSIKSKTYAVSHPIKSLGNDIKAKAEDKAKETAKKAGKKVADSTKEVAKKGAKALAKLVLSNPLIVGIILIVAFVILLLIMLAGSGNPGFDYTCDFNLSTVNIKCKTEKEVATGESTDGENTEQETKTEVEIEDIESLALEDYVIERTYRITKDIEDKEIIKAAIIAIKTDTLANGNYNNETKQLDIFNCGYERHEIEDEKVLNTYKELYEEVYRYAYVDETYDGTIETLTEDDRIVFDSSTLEMMKEKYVPFKELLELAYFQASDETHKQLYDLGKYCNQTYDGGWVYGNNADFWWPIGSDESYLESKTASGDPVNFRINSRFGYRGRICTKNGCTNEGHGGLDIDAATGTNIIASKAGTVINVSYDYSYGNKVIIDHGNNITTLYGHLSKQLVKKGDHVGQGQIIGLAGSTGQSTGPHLHFEIRVQGSKPCHYYYISRYAPRGNSGIKHEEFKDDSENTFCN